MAQKLGSLPPTPGSWLWPGPAPVFLGIWGVNEQMEAISLFFSPFPLSNNYKFLKIMFIICGINSKPNKLVTYQ